MTDISAPPTHRAGGAEIIFIRPVSGSGVLYYLFRALFPPRCGSSKQQELCLEPVTSHWLGPAAVSLFTPGEELQLQAATRLALPHHNH